MTCEMRPFMLRRRPSSHIGCVNVQHPGCFGSCLMLGNYLHILPMHLVGGVALQSDHSCLLREKNLLTACFMPDHTCKPCCLLLDNPRIVLVSI